MAGTKNPAPTRRCAGRLRPAPMRPCPYCGGNAERAFYQPHDGFVRRSACSPFQCQDCGRRVWFLRSDFRRKAGDFVLALVVVGGLAALLAFVLNLPSSTSGPPGSQKARSR